MWKLV